MRLDQFLKASRLCVRRTTAQELCEAGAVTVNGSPARSSRTVRVGDEITIRRHARLLTVRVITVPESKQTARHEASKLFETISDDALTTPPTNTI